MAHPHLIVLRLGPLLVTVVAAGVGDSSFYLALRIAGAVHTDVESLWG